MALHGGLSFYKTQQVVGFDCAGIERLSVPQPITLVSYHLTGRARIGIVFLSALSGSSWADNLTVTVMFYTPRGRAAIRNPWP